MSGTGPDWKNDRIEIDCYPYFDYPQKVSLEDIYQAFKARLMEEIVADVSKLTFKGRLKDKDNG